MYISIDLDDTLLHTDKSLTDYTKDVLNKCQSLGHKIIINTARSLQRTIDIAKIINADYCVLNGGSLVVNKEYKPIYKNPISKEKTEKLIKELSKVCEVVSCQEYTTLYTTRILDNQINVCYRSLELPYEFEAYKILLYKADKEKAKEICTQNQVDFINYLGGNWSRVSTSYCTKFTGLEYVLKYENVNNINDVISFGDDYGDLDMLMKSGIGVAMKNSIPFVLENVQVVCDTNDNDGVAKYLAELFNIN